MKCCHGRSFGCSFLLILLLPGFVLTGQTLSVFNTDPGGFELISANFFAYGSDKLLVRGLTPADFTVTENGIPRQVVSVSCPPLRPSPPISAVLTLDVSGSMQTSTSGTTRMGISKSAAIAGVNTIPLGTSDCAVTSFDDAGYLNQDFTTNKSRLLTAINALQPNSGTNYTQGFLGPAGGITVARTGIHRRILIFLTDGQPRDTPNENAIVTAALKDSVTVYCVTLAMPMPAILRNIASRTNGKWFENVRTQQEAENIYKTILNIAQNDEPCQIVWRSGPDCQAQRTVALAVPSLGMNAFTSFTAPPSSIPNLTVSPSSIAFGGVPLGQFRDSTFTLTAVNYPVVLRNLTPRDPRFALIRPALPDTIVPGQPVQAVIRYTPTDSAMVFTDFNFGGGLFCDNPVLVSIGGYGVRRPALRLVKPNGGEIFDVGTDTVITWDGVAAGDTVNLEYSTDAGSSWMVVNPAATGLRLAWHVPNTPSLRCLARVTKGAAIPILLQHGANVNMAAFSPDGSQVVTASDDNSAKLWNSLNGSQQNSLQHFLNTNAIKSADYSPDGRYILTISDNVFDYMNLWNAPSGSNAHSLSPVILPTGANCGSFSPDSRNVVTGWADNTVRMYDVAGGGQVRTFSHGSEVFSLDYSPDGQTIASGGGNSQIKLWRSSNGNALRTLSSHTASVRTVSFSPDGSRLVSASDDNTAMIWNTATGSVQFTLRHNGGVNSAFFSPDGLRVLTASRDGTAKLWDASSGLALFILRHNGPVNDATFSPDGSTILTASDDNTARLWDAVTGSSLLTLVGHTGSVRSARFNQKATRVVTASADNTARIWDISGAFQQDVSDSLWAIVAPVPVARDVDMGTVVLGGSRDSVVTSFIVNNGTGRLRVDSIVFTGLQAGEFGLVSGAPPFTVPPGDSAAVEFRFQPGAPGFRSSVMNVQTNAGMLTPRIFGNALTESLRVTDLDFGAIGVGRIKDSLGAVILTNIGTSPVMIDGSVQSGPDATQFSIRSGGGGFLLNPGQSHLMDLRFAPRYIGRTTGSITFSYNNRSAAIRAQLSGQGLGGRVSLTNDSGYAGDRKTYPLLIRGLMPGGTQPGAGAPTRFRSKIQFNGTLLGLGNSSPAIRVTRDTAVLTVEDNWDTRSDTLTRLQLVAGLGDIEFTPMDILEFTWLDDAGLPLDYDTQTESGSFKLLGVCRSGGDRLLNPTGATLLRPIAPDPVRTTASLGYEIGEKGHARLYITNCMGDQVLTLWDGQVDIGRYTALVPAGGLPAGSYFCVLQTPTRRVILSFRIVK